MGVGGSDGDVGESDVTFGVQTHFTRRVFEHHQVRGAGRGQDVVKFCRVLVCDPAINADRVDGVSRVCTCHQWKCACNFDLECEELISVGDSSVGILGVEVL